MRLLYPNRATKDIHYTEKIESERKDDSKEQDHPETLSQNAITSKKQTAT